MLGVCAPLIAPHPRAQAQIVFRGSSIDWDRGVDGEFLTYLVVFLEPEHSGITCRTPYCVTIHWIKSSGVGRTSLVGAQGCLFHIFFPSPPVMIHPRWSCKGVAWWKKTNHKSQTAGKVSSLDRSAPERNQTGLSLANRGFKVGLTGPDGFGWMVPGSTVRCERQRLSRQARSSASDPVIDEDPLGPR